MHELNHRLKNSLAVVQSIITRSLRNADTVEEAGSVLQSRIAAYARAHDILLHENWSSTTVTAIVEAAAGVLDWREALVSGSKAHRFSLGRRRHSRSRWFCTNSAPMPPSTVRFPARTGRSSSHCP